MTRRPARSEQRPTLVLQHFFGSSSREWRGVTALLEPKYRVIALDSAGFGDAAGQPGYTVEAMAQTLAATLETRASEACILVGHSMSGKVSMVAASRKPANVRGMVLVGPSPLVAEPIQEADRRTMIEAQRDKESAREFFLKSAKRPLSAEDIDTGVRDVLRASPAAWKHWPESGSREDWSGTVAMLDLPALLIVGENDPAIPLAFQKKHTLPRLRNGRLEVIENAGHLLPYEVPGELAARIDTFAATLS